MNNDYQKYIVHFSKLQVGAGTDGILDADFGRQFFEKLAIHHVTLPAQSRSSIPHAESHEEEFVLILKGHPHAWLNGDLYELSPGDAVGWPSGTGISHSIINNTDSAVEMLCLGERTKAHNKYLYPINLELQKEHEKNWWHDWPSQEFGPHDGKPGGDFKKFVKSERPPYLVYAPELVKKATWSYPGDTETFSSGIRLTGPLGLKEMGIHYEVLQPGERTAWPHAHSKEEEFAYIISGTATVWMNGYTYEAGPGHGVSFIPGTNISHVLINNSKEPVVFLGIGNDVRDEIGDKIYYPFHAARNEECRGSGHLWENRPEVLMGPHDGKPN